MYIYTKHYKTSLKRNGSSNHHQSNCLFNGVSGLTTNKTWQPRLSGSLWGECAGDRSSLNYHQTMVLGSNRDRIGYKLYLPNLNLLIAVTRLFCGGSVWVTGNAHLLSTHSLTNSFKTKAREIINWTDAAMQCTTALLSYSTTTGLIYIAIFKCLFTIISVWCSEIT